MNMIQTVPRRIGRPKWVAMTVLLLALARVLFAEPSGAQSTAIVRVQGPVTPVAVGQAFAVDIAIENAANLGAFEFVVNFNPAIANAANVQLGSLLGSTGRSTAALRMDSAPGQPGMPMFGAYSYGAAAGPGGNGVLATVTMVGLIPGVSQLDLSELIIADIAGNGRPVSVSPGSVTVGGPPPDLNSFYLPLAQRNSNACPPACGNVRTPRAMPASR